MYTPHDIASALDADSLAQQPIGWPVAIQALCSVFVPILQSPTREPPRRLTWIVILIVIVMMTMIGLALALRVPFPGVAASLVELTRTGKLVDAPASPPSPRGEAGAFDQRRRLPLAGTRVRDGVPQMLACTAVARAAA